MAGNAGSIRAGKAFVEIVLDQSKLAKGLKAAQLKLKAFGNSLVGLGGRMIAVATAAAALIAFATKTFAAFDDQMRMVKAVTGSTDKEFQMLTDTAEKLGRETSFTAQQVAEGMTAMGRMGFKASEINAAIPAVLDLARATGTDLGNAAEIAANNMRVFGISTSRMSEVADILTATANGSAQTLTDLAEGLKMAGPQAAAAGDDIKNVAASLGILANMGIKGSLAGTALRKAYSQFANTKVQAKLAQFGISTTDSSGNLRAMPDIMADIGRAMASMPTAQRLAFAEEIFDLRGALAGLQLGGNIQQLNDFINMLQNCGGTASNTAKQMDKGIGGAFRRFQSALEGVQIAVGRIIGDALAPYIDKISLMLNGLAEWVKAHKEVVITVAKVIAVVLAAGAALVALGLAFKTLAFIIGTINTLFLVMKTVVLLPVMAIKVIIGMYHLLTAAILLCKVTALCCWTAIGGPAILIGAALAAIVAIVWNLTGAWDICADAMRGFGGDCTTAFHSIGDIFAKTWTAIKTALASGDLSGAAKVGLAALKLAWLTGIYPLKKAWIGLRNFLADTWTVTVYSILKLGYHLWYGLLYGLKQAGDAMSDLWGFIWNGIANTFSETCEWLEKQWVRFKGVFDSDEEVDAAVRAVEQKYAAEREARENRYADGVQRREQERGALKNEWDSAVANADAAMLDEINENKKKYDGMLGEARDGIDEARREWQEAMDDVRRTAEERSKKTESVREETAKASQRTRQGAIAAGIGPAGGEAVGSFSAKALSRALPTDPVQQKALIEAQKIRELVTMVEKTLKVSQAQGQALLQRFGYTS